MEGVGQVEGLHGFEAGGAHAFAEGRRGGELVDGLGKAGHVIRGGGVAGLAVSHVVQNAVDVRGHEGDAGGHGFDAGKAEALNAGGEGGNVCGVVELVNVCAEAEELHLVGNAELVGKLAEVCAQFSLTGDGVAEVRVLAVGVLVVGVLQLCQSADDDFVVLAGDEFACGEEQQGVCGQVEGCFLGGFVYAGVAKFLQVYPHAGNIAHVLAVEGFGAVVVLLVDGDDVVAEAREKALNGIVDEPVLFRRGVVEVEAMAGVHDDGSPAARAAGGQAGEHGHGGGVAVDELEGGGINDALELAICAEVGGAQWAAGKGDVVQLDAAFFELGYVGGGADFVRVFEVVKIAGDMNFTAEFLLQELDVLLVEPFNEGNNAGGDEHLFHAAPPFIRISRASACPAS